MDMSLQQENELYDHFDRLPDPLLRLIFNQVHDAKSLVRCMSVCKRFSSIVPEIDTISLTIPRRDSTEINSKESEKEVIDRSSKSNTTRGSSRNFLKSLFSKVVTRPIQLILRSIIRGSPPPRSRDDGEFSYYSPREVLKSFNEIRRMRIELPGRGGEIKSNTGGDSVLKWRAEFGSGLQSCVVLGATSSRKIAAESTERSENEVRRGRSESSFSLADDDLKLRVVWTISCLIASSARHHLLSQVVSDHPTLRSVEVTDSVEQGRLVMGEGQIEELRASERPGSSPSERTKVPALKMKLWYAPALELPESGRVMEGATLVLITPVDGGGGSGDGEVLGGAFGGDGDGEALGEAVREMMKKKKTCTLEMNSF